MRGSVRMRVNRCASELVCPGSSVTCSVRLGTSRAAGVLPRVPVGAGRAGRAVPTRSSLLTFLGYSGSCQLAGWLRTSPLALRLHHLWWGLFPRQPTLFTRHLGAWPEAGAPRGQDLGGSAARCALGTGQAGRAGCPSGSHRSPPVPSSGTRALALPQQRGAVRHVYRTPRPALSAASGAKRPKNLLRLT